MVRLIVKKCQNRYMHIPILALFDNQSDHGQIFGLFPKSFHFLHIVLSHGKYSASFRHGQMLWQQ